MFIQLGHSYSMATLLSASLLLPSILKQVVLFKNKSNLHLKYFTLLMQTLLFAAFILTAYIVRKHYSGVFIPFLMLMLVSVLNALNEKCVANYYNNQLDRKMQKVLGNYKFITSQIAFAVTYGILIIFVGLHEIFFRNIRLAWAMQYYLIAGVLLILLIINTLLLKKPDTNNAVVYRHVRLKRINKKIKFRNLRFLFIVTMLLLPQALLFATRVFFLMAKEDEGGLGCALQDVGFAQGTIGIIAFSIGTFIGQKLLRKTEKIFWIMIIPLLASPVFYLIMNYLLLTDLMHICIMTFASQFCFGFGLNICLILIRRTTDVFEDNIITLIHNPIVVAAMFIPIAASGFLLELLGFKLFFILNVACAFLSILTLAINYKFIVKHILKYKKIVKY